MIRKLLIWPWEQSMISFPFMISFSSHKRLPARIRYYNVFMIPAASGKIVILCIFIAFRYSLIFIKKLSRMNALFEIPLFLFSFIDPLPEMSCAHDCTKHNRCSLQQGFCKVSVEIGFPGYGRDNTFQKAFNGRVF